MRTYTGDVYIDILSNEEHDPLYHQAVMQLSKRIDHTNIRGLFEWVLSLRALQMSRLDEVSRIAVFFVPNTDIPIMYSTGQMWAILIDLYQIERLSIDSSLKGALEI